MARTAENSVISAFTEDQASRLTGVSVHRLRHWDRTSFFEPSMAYENRRSPYSRLYTFRDLVSLKIIASLRDDAKVSLQHLREVRDRLLHLGDDIWTSTTLFVLNRKVVFVNPETQRREEVVSGQGVLQIPIRVVAEGIEQAANTMRQRDVDTVGKTEKSRGFAHNQEVVAGTRIPVRSVRAFHDAGYSIKEILHEYPTLKPEDIRIAVGAAAA